MSDGGGEGGFKKISRHVVKTFWGESSPMAAGGGGGIKFSECGLNSKNVHKKYWENFAYGCCGGVNFFSSKCGEKPKNVHKKYLEIFT